MNKQSSNNQSAIPAAKKPYEAPKLEVLGEVKELTRQITPRPSGLRP